MTGSTQTATEGIVAGEQGTLSLAPLDPGGLENCLLPSEALPEVNEEAQ
jgi:hypothetical protein